MQQTDAAPASLLNLRYRSMHSNHGGTIPPQRRQSFVDPLKRGDEFEERRDVVDVNAKGTGAQGLLGSQGLPPLVFSSTIRRSICSSVIGGAAVNAKRTCSSSLSAQRFRRASMRSGSSGGRSPVFTQRARAPTRARSDVQERDEGAGDDMAGTFGSRDTAPSPAPTRRLQGVLHGSRLPRLEYRVGVPRGPQLRLPAGKELCAYAASRFSCEICHTGVRPKPHAAERNSAGGASRSATDKTTKGERDTIARNASA